MTADGTTDPGHRLGLRRAPRQMRRALVMLCLGCLAMLVPFVAGPAALWLLGLVVAAAGVLQMLQGFDQPDGTLRRSSFYSGGMSVGIGGLLLISPTLVASGLTLLLAGSFILDGCSQLLTAWRNRAESGWMVMATYGSANVLIGMLTALQWPLSGAQAIGIYVGLRILSTGWTMLAAPPVTKVEPPLEWTSHPDSRLRLSPHPELTKMVAAVNAEEEARRAIDRYWQLTFLLTFLAIHAGRMDADWTLVGLISPLVAVIGDIVYALVLALGIVTPIHLAWRRLTRRLERRAWASLLPRLNRGRRLGPGWQVVKIWVLTRLRFAMRVRRAYTSPAAALRRGLQVGLPLTAILVAVNPIWGMSWFFNTETWAAGVWEKWVEYRVDPWRQAMVQAVRDLRPQAAADSDLIEVMPKGVAAAVDFSFLVIGDPGEGDSSQHSLKDQYLRLGMRPDVKFMVVSSDVIYPDGAMKDYEFKFYLPFKGFEKPIYAIPGNHDWYDCLEGFNATFLEPDAARAAMRARIAADHRLTTTTERGIDALIAEAGRLRQQYGVKSGGQLAPYFDIQSSRFALIAVDTGVLRTVDDDRLERALDRSRGKFRMVILGHPLYVAGHYDGVKEEIFAKIHGLLREHEVELVMAGDTHDFEYYREQYESHGKIQAMHHFVNGGGGAYLSTGTALDWPKSPPVPDCAYYPRTDALIAKLDSQTPGWKLPLWWWVKRIGAWPSSPEAMAGAFDFNRAPFFQSFVEVRVEGASNRVRIIPYGVHGPLRWQDLQCLGAVVPAGQTAHGFAEFVFPLPVISNRSRPG